MKEGFIDVIKIIQQTFVKGHVEEVWEILIDKLCFILSYFNKKVELINVTYKVVFLKVKDYISIEREGWGVRDDYERIKVLSLSGKHFPGSEKRENEKVD